MHRNCGECTLKGLNSRREGRGGLNSPGRASLWVYIVHIPIAYGWSSFPGLAWRVGRTQELLPALGLALGVLALSLGLALPAKRLHARWRGRGRDMGQDGGAPLPVPAPALAPEPPSSGG